MDTLELMNASNKPAREKYEKLSQEANQIGQDLMRAINMDIGSGNDNQLLQKLVESLNRAKELGMRGEVIDIATTLKALCTKLLQEMVSQAPKDEEDNDDSHQKYILREEDKKSVFDPKYFEYISKKSLEDYDLNMALDLEPNLGLHPYQTDYMKLALLNLNYAKRNMDDSRKVLYEEEIYPIINVHTRAAFLLADGRPESSKSLQFSNIRDDMMLRYARLIFRYRLNLDQCFPIQNEPAVFEGRADLQSQSFLEVVPSLGILQMEDYKGLSDSSLLAYSEMPLPRSLNANLEKPLWDKALQLNLDLIRIQHTAVKSKDFEQVYRLIR